MLVLRLAGIRPTVRESAILVCGMHVDLNQIRAEEARTPETVSGGFG